jgi:hypothetical protein
MCNDSAAPEEVGAPENWTAQKAVKTWTARAVHPVVGSVLTDSHDGHLVHYTVESVIQAGTPT